MTDEEAAELTARLEMAEHEIRTLNGVVADLIHRLTDAEEKVEAAGDLADGIKDLLSEMWNDARTYQDKLRRL